MRIVTACAVAGLLLGLLGSFALPEEYVSETIVRLNPLFAWTDPDAQFSRLAATILPGGVDVDRIEFEGRSAFRLTFRDRNPYVAMNTLQDVDSDLQSGAATLPRGFPPPRLVTSAGALDDLYPLQILDLPTFPEMPSPRPRIVASGVGLAAGLLLGAILRLRQKRS